jgi:hypothetical protein
MNGKENLLSTINELHDILEHNHDTRKLNQVFLNIMTIIESLYGKNDNRIKMLSELKAKFDIVPWNTERIGVFNKTCAGFLDGIKKDIENNLILNVERQTIGSVVADIISLAKTSADENVKDVAAVLGSAALEDALKRYAKLNGVDADERAMTDVINLLKSKGLVKGPQASLLGGYVQTRNRAFHAQWDKLDLPEIKSLIYFTEQFILEKLS